MSTYYAASPVVRAASRSSSSQDHYTLGMPVISDHNISQHMSRREPKTVGHARTYFNSARGQLYSRYSQGEWAKSNHSNFSLSEQERATGEKIRADAFQAVKQADTRTRNRQNTNTQKLNERVHDIRFWKNELVNEMRAMDGETENLAEHKRILEKALADTRGPQQIAEECLMQREKRQGIDLVNDEVERDLSKEVATIKKCQDKMHRLVEKANVQLKMNRAALHACDKDSKDKFHAQTLDDRMQQMRNTSGGIGFHPGVEGIDNTMTIPYSWVKFTQENIRRSQHEREMSEKLRGEIDSMLRAFANAMWSQFNAVNNAFQHRIQETNDAKNKLQAHLARTNNEIRDMERSIALLRKAIYDQEAPMKVAQSRLMERTSRINVELCHDPSMKGLKTEVHEIRESVRVLKEKLRGAENALVRLLTTKKTLEQDISVKENSLQIDSKYCMGMRKNMPMDPKIGPIFNMPLHPY